MSRTKKCIENMLKYLNKSCVLFSMHLWGFLRFCETEWEWPFHLAIGRWQNRLFNPKLDSTHTQNS